MRIALLAALPLLVSAAPPGGAPVTVAVSGVTTNKGLVKVDICTPATFTRASCPWSAKVAARQGTTVVTVPGVPPGRYAAQAHHDANGNGKPDLNFLGIPSEMVGFSNDVRVRTAPPKFAAAAFDHGSETTHLAFSVRKVP